jgi:hypothetical protein
LRGRIRDRMPAATPTTAAIATIAVVVTRCWAPAIRPLEIPAILVINHAVVSVLMRVAAAPAVPRRRRSKRARGARFERAIANRGARHVTARRQGKAPVQPN